MTVPRWWPTRRPQRPPPGARVVAHGTIYGTSEDTPPGSMAAHMADAFFATRAVDLAEKRPVTLNFQPAGFLGRLVLVRPAVREVTRRLKSRGYVLTRRERYTWTFTYEA